MASTSSSSGPPRRVNPAMSSTPSAQPKAARQMIDTSAIQRATSEAIAKAGPPQRSPSLSNASPEMRAIRDDMRKELVDCLDSVRGAKALVLDPKLIGPLGLIAEVALLREHHVEKIHHLNGAKMDTPCPNIVYLCRPRVEYMKHIADHIHWHAQDNQRKHYAVFFVPRKSMIAERILEEEGVYGDITVHSFSMDLIPFDDDLLSLELDHSLRECLLEGDPTSLFHVARALMRLQDYYGLFPKILGVGDSAKLVKDMLLRIRKERGAAESALLPEIDQLVLIDRQVDMVTPMVTQQTLEGLIDEIFGVNCSFVELDADLVAVSDQQPSSSSTPPPTAANSKNAAGKEGPKKVTYPLNSNDSVYSEFRDQNFEALGARIRTKAQQIKDTYDQLQALQNMHELRAFLTTLPQTKQQELSLSVLSNICHKINATYRQEDYPKRVEAERAILGGGDPQALLGLIDEMIDRQAPLIKVLRLLILLSSVHGGLSAKHFEHYQREIVQTYGYEHLFTLANLTKLGLIKRSAAALVGARSGFAAAHKPMHLWVPDVDKSDPDDMAYVFSGYAPLSVRLVQHASAPGWRAMAEVIRAISPTAFEVNQPLPASVEANLARRRQTSNQQGLDRPPTTLVFFIGGVTFAEIAALRYLATHSESRRTILIATTKMINGDSLISSLMDAVPIPTLEDS